MRIGLMAGATAATGTGIKAVVDFAKMAEERGFDTVWMANVFGLDAIGACAIGGWETSRIEFGTAVTPSYPRHPTALAQQAVTTSVCCDGRFTLGIGLSHKLVIEDMLGMSYDKPAAHMNEYLQVLGPLLRGEAVDFSGAQYQVKLALDVPGASAVPLMVAALGPAMLKLAGTYADGTTTWMTGPNTLENYIVPNISAAASEAGRGSPRIVCGLPIVVTGDADGAREKIAKDLAVYGMLPSYRAMLDREGVEGPANLSIVGDESSVRNSLARLRDVGVTDFNAAITPYGEGSLEATLDVLQSELG
ncbi:MAG: LLM class F420-dependent oxidoreductase [Halieaceae bacterium]|jgi:5,10-methylenetetrahydromethanopterin reductase|nr:LLM class F420-dependent oxidoreductase [Halieaceae bacterium]